VLNSFFWKVVTGLNEKIVVSFAYPAITWLVVSAVIGMKIGDTHGWSRDMQAWIILAPVALILLTFPASLVFTLIFTASSGFLLLPFGVELGALAFIIRARADAKPPAKAHTPVNVNSPLHRLRSLRHSVYEVRAAREALAKWIVDCLTVSWLPNKDL
jgi:hypothetical protein